MSIWFSSDFHFGHKNIAGKEISDWKEGYRNFSSVEQMNKTITDTVNKYVKHDDTLIFLGDFGFGGHTNIPSYRHSLQVQTIHLIRGNHDEHIDKYADLFTAIDYYKEFHINKRLWVLFHYPILSWNKIGKGSFMLHGHCHGDDNIDAVNLQTKRLDVGIDSAYKLFGEYRPFHLDEIISILSKRNTQPVDHHTEKIRE